MLSSEARLRSLSANVVYVERLAQKGSQSQGAAHNSAAAGLLAAVDLDHKRRIARSAENGKAGFLPRSRAFDSGRRLARCQKQQGIGQLPQSCRTLHLLAPHRRNGMCQWTELIGRPSFCQQRGEG